MWSFPTLEPVVSPNGDFLVERVLSQPGTVHVNVGDAVAPDTVVAESGDEERIVTLYVANELAVDNHDVTNYLSKSIGSTVKEGDSVARVRRGLRSVSVKAPVTGTLISADEATGTVMIATSMGPRTLPALLNGEVERVISERGAIIHTRGLRIYGIVGFGGEATGPLVIGNDRHDRELTADHVLSDWQGSIVLAGMTTSVPVLNKLRESGVRGVIVGSLAESDVRRFLKSSDASAGVFWNEGARASRTYSKADSGDDFVVFVTEGFGRQAMSDEIYEQLRTHSGIHISVVAQTVIGDQLTRPELYITESEWSAVEAAPLDNSVQRGRVVRLVDPSRPGVSGIANGEPFNVINERGIASTMVEIKLSNGDVRDVPLVNLEVIY